MDGDDMDMADMVNVIKVNSEKEYQEIEGFGILLSDSSGFLLMELKESDKMKYEKLIKMIFGKDEKEGSNINVLRIVCGSSDAVSSVDYYSYEESSVDGNFTIERDLVNVIPVLKDILKVRKDIKIIASPWSAPGWMKDNGKLKGGSLVEYDLYSDYIIKFLKSYQQQLGRQIDYMTLQNEPYYNLADYPCMYVDQVKLLKLLNEKMANEKQLTTKFLLHDHNWDLSENATNVINQIIKEIKSFNSWPIHGIAWHAYNGERWAQKEVRETFPSKNLHTFFTEMTAWGVKLERQNGVKGNFRWCFQNILIGTLRHLSEVVLYLNLILDDKNGPTPRLDSQAWGLITKYSKGKVLLKPEIEFIAVSHFSKFINFDLHTKRIYSETFVNNTWADIDSKMQKEKNFEMDGPLESVAFMNKESIIIVVFNPSWMKPYKKFDVILDDKYKFSYQLCQECAVTFKITIQKNNNAIIATIVIFSLLCVISIFVIIGVVICFFVFFKWKKSRTFTKL